MICPKCGQENNEGSTFCIKCGTNLKVQEFKNEEVSEEAPVEATPAVSAPEAPVAQPVAEAPAPAVEPTAPAAPAASAAPAQPKTGFNVFAYIIAAFLKPLKSFGKEKDKLSTPKDGFIFGGIVVLAMTIGNYLKNAIIYVHAYESLDALGEMDYVDLLLKKLLIYAVIVFGIAGVMYLVKLVVKKEANYLKHLAIVGTSLISYVLVGMLLSTILGLIWNHLRTIVYELAVIYTIINMYELINDDLQLEGGKRIYVNLILFGAIFIIFYIAALALDTGFGFGIAF